MAEQLLKTDDKMHIVGVRRRAHAPRVTFSIETYDELIRNEYLPIAARALFPNLHAIHMILPRSALRTHCCIDRCSIRRVLRTDWSKLKSNRIRNNCIYIL